MQAVTFRALAVATASLAVVVALLLAAVVQRDSRLAGDAAQYLAVAEGASADAPYAFRIAIPVLARGLPGSPPLGFEILTVIGIASAAVLLFCWLQRRVTTARAALGVALFLVSGPVAALLRNPYLTDAPAWAFVAAVLVLTDRRQWRAVGLMLAAGVLIRETVVLAAVIPGVALVRAKKWSSLAFVASPAAVVICAVRLLVVTSGRGASIGDPSDVFTQVAEWNGTLPRAALHALAYSFGAGFVAIPLLRRSPLRSDRALVVYGLACLATLLVAVDWLRLLGNTYPVLALAVAMIPVRDLFVGAAVAVQVTSWLSIVVHGWRPTSALAVAIGVAQICIVYVGTREAANATADVGTTSDATV